MPKRKKQKYVRRENKEFNRFQSANWTLRKVLPKWANKEYMRLFYIIAVEEEKATGQRIEIDHIVPINSPLVCGLHNEFNLSYLTRKDNMKKSNNFWPDMPAYEYKDIMEIIHA